MRYKISGNLLQPVRVAKNDFHAGDSFLAFFYLVIVRAFISALLIIFFDFLKFLLIQKHLGSPAFVYNANGNIVLHRFLHGVGIHNLAKDIERGINGRSGESDVGGVGQGVVQIFREPICFLNTVSGQSDFLVKVYLRAMGFV